MAPEWTGDHGLDVVLAELVDNARAVLVGDLYGVYLQGSFALGGADAESDCDFVVVTARPVDPNQLEALRAFHAELPGRPGYWHGHLEGSYAPRDDLADLTTTGRPWPYVDHGSDKVTLDGHCNTTVARWILREHGVTLTGPHPRTFAVAVPPDVMRASARASLTEAVAAWEAHPRWDAWSQRHAVLTMPRMLRTQLVGDVLSKPAAVTWASDVLDPEWRPLLHAAMAGRGQRPWDAPIDADLAARTLDFVRYVGRVAS